MGLGKKKKGAKAADGVVKPAPKSPLDIIEPFSATPSFTPRKKEPVVSTQQNSRPTVGPLIATDGGSVVSTEGSLNGGSSVTTGSVQGGLYPVEHEQRAPSSSGSSTSSSTSSYPPEFPTPSSQALKMTLQELLKTSRSIRIPRTKRGFGFHIKGLSSKNTQFEPSVEAPCSQFMFGVDKASEAEKAGVLANDFIYKVNGKEVMVASHKEVVEMIRKSGNPLTLDLIQVTSQPIAPAPAVPKRNPGTKLQGPVRAPITRTQSLANGGAPPRQEEQIYANVNKVTTPPATVELDHLVRCQTMPARPPPAPEPESPRKEEVVMIPVLPQATAAQISEQRKRLFSTNGDNQSLKSTQSEPVQKPPRLAVPAPTSATTEDEDEDDSVLYKSKSAEDIARKAEEMRLRRLNSISSGADKPTLDYSLPPPPAVVPPPPPPDDLPPPPPIMDRSMTPPPPPTDREDNESWDSGFVPQGGPCPGRSPLEDWDAQDVAEWLCGVGLGDYRDIFLDNDIRGINLPDLSKDDMKDLGVTKLGHRMTMVQEIKRLSTEGR